MKILGGLYTTGGVHTHTLWCILKNIAGRQENHRIIFLTHLDNDR